VFTAAKLDGACSKAQTWHALCLSLLVRNVDCRSRPFDVRLQAPIYRR
jgi:hypothetical protein